MKYKTLLLIVLLFVSVTVSGCLRKGDVKQNELSNESLVEDFSGSLSDLFKKGETVMCTFGNADEKGSMTGVAYIDGTRSRQDIILNITEGTTVENHIIIDNEWMYSWNSAQPNKGIKMNYQDMINSTEDSEDSEDVDIDNQIKYQKPDQEFNFKCDAWDVEASIFKLPDNIKFTDLSDITKQFEEITEDANDINSKLENIDTPNIQDMKDIEKIMKDL